MNKIYTYTECVRAAYEVADENGKKMLRALYPGMFTQSQTRAESNRPVIERLKTFDDACHEIGETHPLVQQLNVLERDMAEKASSSHDVVTASYIKLCIVVAALNEGWTPDWGNKNQHKWYPYFYILSEKEYDDLSEEDKCRVVGRAHYSAGANGGLVYSNAYNVSTNSSTVNGSRLAFKSKELAEYCGKQFGELWATFHVG